MKYVISFYDESLKRELFLTKLKGNEICWSDFPNQGIKFETAEKAKNYVLENYKILKWTHHERVTIVAFENNFLNNFEKEILKNETNNKST